MSYHDDGLGQTTTGSALVSLLPHSAELLGAQRRLIADGLLRISAPDGIISATSSPTLTAIRAFATNHGLSATGVARTPTGGVYLRRDLADTILGVTPTSSGPSPVALPAPSGGGKGDMGPPAPDGPLLPYAPPVASDMGWVPWAIGGTVAVVVLGTAAYAATR